MDLMSLIRSPGCRGAGEIRKRGGETSWGTACKTRGEDCWSGPCAATINGSARHVEIALKRSIVEERKDMATLRRAASIKRKIFHNPWVTGTCNTRSCFRLSLLQRVLACCTLPDRAR